MDGYEEIENVRKANGASISCGIDSLSTIYKYYELEKDLDYRFIHLFFFNCGWHGRIDNPNTKTLFLKRALQAEKVPDEIGLPLVRVDSNLHAFLYNLDNQVPYFNLHTIIFALDKSIGKYYLSRPFSYEEVLKCGYKSAGRDFSEYGNPISLPLLATKNTRIISDGCQYKRSEKTKFISNWGISKKYLNVCCRNSDNPEVDEKNCSECPKCNRTMVALDALGMLDKYSSVFDIKK